MDLWPELDDMPPSTPGDETARESANDKPQREQDRRLVLAVAAKIKADKRHHDKAFKRMRRDMFIARHGRTPEWSETNYKANFVGRHIRNKTASLYAKNPKAIAKRRETLDFTIWDENPQSLELAFQSIQMAQQAMVAAPPTADPLTGQLVPGEPPPELMAALEQAQAVIADFQQGTERRMMMRKIGRTLEILFAHALREQQPLDAKASLKRAVRRACTTGVGYVELTFQREYGPPAATVDRLSDVRGRLEHMRRLAEDIESGDIGPDDPEIAELEAAVRTFENEPEVIIREGLILDFPPSTRVIPDRLCTSIIGFLGARHVTVEYLFTVEQIKKRFEVDIGKNYTGYTVDGKHGDTTTANIVPDDDDGDVSENGEEPAGKGSGLVLVWKHFDKESGLVYYLADGYDKWLREPAAPEVFVEDFWPIYALTFNAVEDEEGIFPSSDVTLLEDQQMEHNRARQGMRDHRWAARPRWAGTNGMLDDDDVEKLTNLKPFETIMLNKEPGSKIGDIFEPFPVPGVDPNLYETGQIFTDFQLVGGTQEAQMGAVSRSTATESAIAANSVAAADGSSVDDLDTFLTMLARASGQILLREMSEDTVKRIVGPGAVWPHLSLAEIASELYLEVQAGSTGKPNQAVEISNWEKMAPLLLQMPRVSPDWLARETIRRLDDNADLTEAIAAGLPAIVAQNRMAQPATGDPATDPTQQGPQGGDNGPKPPGLDGSTAPMGNNRV
jgi:hypothetical protein